MSTDSLVDRSSSRARNRQGPKVRQHPENDDQEQRQRLQVEVTDDGSPAQCRRCRARRAANYDVLRGRALEPHRVDHCVKKQ